MTYECLGKALARGSGYKSIADAVMDSAALRKAVDDRLCSDVNIERKRSCLKARRAVGQEIREKSR